MIAAIIENGQHKEGSGSGTPRDNVWRARLRRPTLYRCSSAIALLCACVMIGHSGIYVLREEGLFD